MWNEIQPTEEWIENQVPDTIRPFCMVTPSAKMDVDYEAMKYVPISTTVVYVHILTTIFLLSVKPIVTL